MNQNKDKNKSKRIGKPPKTKAAHAVKEKVHRSKTPSGVKEKIAHPNALQHTKRLKGKTHAHRV